jgi:hypothetical protein
MYYTGFTMRSICWRSLAKRLIISFPYLSTATGIFTTGIHSYTDSRYGLSGQNPPRKVPCKEEGGYMVRTRNYVANDDQKNRAVRNAGHHP